MIKAAVMFIIIVLGLLAIFILVYWISTNPFRRPRLIATEGWLWVDKYGKWHLTINIENFGNGDYKVQLTPSSIKVSIDGKQVKVIEVDPANFTVLAHSVGVLELMVDYDPRNKNLVKVEILLPEKQELYVTVSVERG